MSRNIYVADLNAYNAGVLHGVTIYLDETDLDTAIKLTNEMLKNSPVPGGEEYEIHDSEGFNDLNPESITQAFVFHDFMMNSNVPDDLITREFLDLSICLEDAMQDLEDRYRGTYTTKEDYADEFLNETGYFENVPEIISNYFDYAAYARDLQLGGDVEFVECADGWHVLAN